MPCPTSRLTAAGFQAALGCGLLINAHDLAAQPAPSDCAVSEVQPEAIDLDQPRDQLARQTDLTIPEGARIGEIRIVRRPIFNTSDPAQDNVLYRALNTLNIPTWESTLRAQLVFDQGDRYQPGMIEESERILRQRAYLTAAWVGITRVCGDQLEVTVLARDTWTLLPSLGASRSGGENTTNTGFSDSNFLGSGKSIGVALTKDADRTETSLDLNDPNVFGSHWRSGVSYDKLSDGRSRSVYLERPFYSELADWQFGVTARDDKREQSRYVGAEAIAEYRRQQDFASVDAGWRIAEDNGRLLRLLTGYRYDARAFERLPDEPALDALPADRSLSYPWIGFQYLENEFQEMTNLTRLQRVEDVRDGVVWRTELGYSSPDLGATEERAVLNMSFSDALVATETAYVSYGFTQSGTWRFDQDRAENLTATVNLEGFYGGQETWNSWYSSLAFTAAHNLTLDQQLLIGGDNGLRGYPSSFQQGDRRALWTMERRYFPDWHPFKLFRVGGVVFTDLGRAWFQDGRSNGPEEGVLTDAGFGLRLASSRIDVGRMLHLDFAFPLVGNERIDQVQVLLRGRTRF